MARPGALTEELAIGMGFSGLGDLFARSANLREAIDGREPMARLDWLRALLAMEIVFVSDLVGSGHDWVFTTGLSDGDTIDLLRGLQRKLGRETARLVGHGLGTRPD
jgi:hypothetical protein